MKNKHNNPFKKEESSVNKNASTQNNSWGKAAENKSTENKSADSKPNAWNKSADPKSGEAKKHYCGDKDCNCTK